MRSRGKERIERRSLQDRRKKPASSWSFYTFFGRRRKFRRKSDQGKGGYTDRFSPTLFILIILILALNILDSLFTMIIIDLGGKEFNPIVRSVIALHGDRFWIWKFMMVSGSLVLLYIHRGFRFLRPVLIAITSLYLVLVIYQIVLIRNIRTPH
jgi:hypothetical protein